MLLNQLAVKLFTLDMGFCQKTLNLLSSARNQEWFLLVHHQVLSETWVLKGKNDPENKDSTDFLDNILFFKLKSYFIKNIYA